MVSSWVAEPLGSVLAGRYRVVAPIGAGASARVFLADDLQLHRRVALKVLHDALADDPAFLKRFRAEARSAASMSHPNVMHVYDSGEQDGVPFLVLEFLGGGSLRAVLDQGRPLSPSQALVVGLGAARGLDYAHRRGLVHRDIKPANLLFDEEARLRIADFGLARAIAEATWTEPQGLLLGTARYTSPEQARGEEVDGRGDVYSLALVLVEAVTGRVPFARDTVPATLMARCDGDLEVPAELGRLRPVLERAGRLDPELRPDAGELEIAFLAAAEEMDRPRPIPLPGAIPAAVLDARARGDEDPTLVVTVDDITQIGPLPTPASGAEPPGATEDTAAPGRGRRERRVEREDRRAGTALIVVLLLAVVALGSAAVWFFLIRTPTHALPDVVGTDVATAKRRLATLGFRVTTEFTRQDGTEPDEVVGQSPAARTELEEGRQIELTVSLGNTLVALPALDPSLDEAAAVAALEAAGLAVGEVTRPNDETVPQGFLISSTAEVDASGQLPKTSPVDLVISAGPAPRTVPNGLVGQSIDAVTRLLADLRLGVDVTERYDPEVPKGTVLSVNPADGASVPRDTKIAVVVSKGPEPVPIPDVRGKTGTEATAILEAAGFGVSGIEGSPSGPVLQTDPPAGEPHVRGSVAVRIFTRQ